MSDGAAARVVPVEGLQDKLAPHVILPGWRKENSSDFGILMSLPLEVELSTSGNLSLAIMDRL